METEKYKEAIEEIKKNITSYPDFPKPGILFRDFFSVLKNPKTLPLLRDVLITHIKSLKRQPTCVVGLDSRGFLLGPLIALEFHIPFIPIRKKGKLPGRIASLSFTLEYGEDVFEIQEDSVSRGDLVLIVDDLLATGGSMAAACDLITQIGGEVIESLVVMELCELNGRAKVSGPVHSLIQY